MASVKTKISGWVAALLIGFTLTSQASTNDLRFKFQIKGDGNVPTMTLWNLSRTLSITGVKVTIGDTLRTFDSANNFIYSAGVNATVTSPDTVDGSTKSAQIDLAMTGFLTGRSFSMNVDLDSIFWNSVENFRTVMFNNGASPNAVVTVTASDGSTASVTLPDFATYQYSYDVSGGAPQYTLRIKSQSEVSGPGGSVDYVRRTKVTVGGVVATDLGGALATNVGSEVSIKVFAGDTVEITCPLEVYRDMGGKDIADSDLFDPDLVEAKAQERFVASGMSINDVVQTGDSTFFNFDMSKDTVIVVKWRHDYALTVTHDFVNTQSLEKDAAGNPWAGPLNSLAAGNPEPVAKKHWVKQGEMFIAAIDGQVADFSHPGLDIRYVPTAYKAYGPPNSSATEAQDIDVRLNQQLDLSVNPASLSTTFFYPPAATSDLAQQAPPQRQQVPQCAMYGPGGITYIWQIQYGVKVNMDDVTRAGLAKVFQIIGNNYQPIGDMVGTFWFNPGSAVTIGSAANVTDQNSLALIGWNNGDGYYFSNNGSIDTATGGLVQGGPVLKADGSPVAQWTGLFFDANGKRYRGLSIPQLQRPARVQWSYGNQTVVVNVPIGEYVFQNDPQRRADVFLTQPDQIKMISVTGKNKNVGDMDMSIWDPVALKLYPLIPGQFSVKWRPDPASANFVNVVVNSYFPDPAHYPHVINTPPVSVDPDPNDSITFKEVKYTENEAGVDGQKWFTATKAGKSVLLFGEIQRVGRGTPREYVRVRVVDSKDYKSVLTEGASVVGQKITAPDLDLAKLETGYVMSFSSDPDVPDKTRYNPYIYDVTKLNGLAALNIYNMTKLRSSTGEKLVINKQNLPGPIIPVNLHPRATISDRVVVVWYADPATHDGLLWPHAARSYTPAWPTTAAQGLGRIVIASQYGSESLSATGVDQILLPASVSLVRNEAGDVIGTNMVPAETTFNPTRCQQVAVYSQPDPSKLGYNPNEEHGVMAPSLRFATVSPRPPSVYALRNNDLNRYASAYAGESGQPTDYTSHPFVMVQFYDALEKEFKMRVFKVVKEDRNIPGYRFADENKLVSSSTPQVLNAEPHVSMFAGEPVIPFYPLGVVIGAQPPPQTFGTNLKGQAVYWKDHKNTSWSISGGDNAWFSASFYYPLTPDFWWPENKPGMITETVENGVVVRKAEFPQTGDAVSFVPKRIKALLDLAPSTTIPSSLANGDIVPSRVLFKSDWPVNPATLKAGETLTFAGGEYRADHPLKTVATATGGTKTVETPGLPGILAFASAEIIYDSMNSLAETSKWKTKWTARVAQVLESRKVPLSLADFPADLQPATKRTRVRSGKYVFSELPASLQKRVLFDPINGKLEVIGQLNDKGIGDRTLTASPPAVYVLEPNIITAEEGEKLLALSSDAKWSAAVTDLIKLSRNPSLIDSDNASVPLPADSQYRYKLETFWKNYYAAIGVLPIGSVVPLPVSITAADDDYLVGLSPKVLVDGVGKTVTVEDPVFAGIMRTVSDPRQAAPIRAFGPGLALIPNAGFLDPTANLPEISWVSVVENNDPTLGGSPVTIHVIKVDRRERYRGAIKTILSDNVFDENIVLRHQGDFGANADDLYFEWWYRPDDGSLDVPPPDLTPPGQTNPWKVFSDPSGKRGQGRFQITLKGNPNAPELLLADSWWFVRYRHKNDLVEDTNWAVPQPEGQAAVNFTWAGAGNSDPFHDYDLNGIPDFRAQLAMGWIKRVLDAVNPYEARIRDFEGDNPSTISSMLSEFGARFEGPVALNPDKNVIENVGLIELYETILKRGRDLSIDLSRPVSTPAVANALQLASTRISDFYTILGNEAYSDSVDPTIGFGSGSVEYGSLAPSVFTFQNQVSSLMEEELGLLRGVDDYFARPVYNRFFWNFTKGEGEAAYAMNYNVSDINADGFIDEKDAMILYPQGHGDAWGHYLTALRNQYELLKHENFNWVSRSEFYNLMDVVMKVDFLDERKFAQTAATKAKVGAEIVNLTYRSKYVDDPTAQWQGYTDSNKDKAWGVQEWARRAGQGAFFDWVTANALLPSTHPNTTLEGIQKVDRANNSDIAVVSANLNAVQYTFDQANEGYNPLGLSGNLVPFDIDPSQLPDGTSHFEQIFERATKALGNAKAVWDNANESLNRVRAIANTESEYRNDVYQEDLAYKNSLIGIFGKPYEGTVGSGRIYPAGYDGPDTLLFMYVDVRNIDNSTVPGPTKDFATFNSQGLLNGGDLYTAFVDGTGGKNILNMSESVRKTFAPSFAPDSSGVTSVKAKDGMFAVNYTDLVSPRVPLENMNLPVTAAGYTFQAPRDWGSRQAIGELQLLVNQMIQQEAAIAGAIAEWDGLQGDIVAALRMINAKLLSSDTIRARNEAFARSKYIIENTLKGITGAIEIIDAVKGTVTTTFQGAIDSFPVNLPTAGLAFSPGDALAPARGATRFASVAVVEGISWGETALKVVQLATEIGLDVAQNEVDLANDLEDRAQSKREWLAELEASLGDEANKRIQIFKEIEALRALSEQYRAKVDEGTRLMEERAAFNKRVAANTQMNRYQDMTFRVSRNHALQSYRSSFNLAARYAYMAAKAYDYETNLDPSDPGSPSDILADIMKARTIGLFDGDPRLGAGGLSDALARLSANYDVLKTQLGINNPQVETGKMSLRTERYRILPKGATQPAGQQFPGAGSDSDELWRQTLTSSKVADLWMVPEYRYYCRPFSAESDASGVHVPEPGIVLRFGSQIRAGKNFFGMPLSGGDHAFDPSHFATKIRSIGVWMSDYLSDDVMNDLPAAPRVYLVPVGTDVMSLPYSMDPNLVRLWKVIDQRIPVPIPAVSATLDNAAWTPLLDSLNGRLGDTRKFSALRAYHDGTSTVNMDELVSDTRLIGRSVWNTEWMLIIPGRMLNTDPDEGLQRFINQVSDVKLVFETYSHSGN